MKKLLLAMVLFGSNVCALADESYFGAGTLFIPQSGFVTIGHKWNEMGVQATVWSHGEEEPTTKPGPEICLDAMWWIPNVPVFLHAGLVTGNGKDGYRLGLGAEYRITQRWSVRLISTFHKVTEDFNEPPEDETLISAGLFYRF